MANTQQSHASPHRSLLNKCLKLAEKSQGKVAPNPMVGAILVYFSDDQEPLIIGQGYHEKYGEAHAEVHAIQNILHVSGNFNTLYFKFFTIYNL